MKIKQTTLEALIARLMWISRETLDLDRLLVDEEYLEAARAILDDLGADYNDAERKYKERKE